MNDRTIKTIDAWRERGTFLDDLKKAYLCDGCDEECGKGLCYKIKREGKLVCHHTRKIEHALPCEGERKFARYGEYLLEVRDGQ